MIDCFSMRTMTFTLRTECDKCGDMIPVNGPLRHVVCGSCQAQYDLTPSVWSTQVASSSEGYRILNNPYTCNDTDDTSRMCPACEKHFPFDEAAVEGDEEIHCPYCGREIHSYPAPDWLVKELPAVVHVVGGDREEGEGGSGVVLQPEETQRPVVLSCPNCGGGLKVTGESERLIPCEHCNTDVYLPDGVWRRLHPVDTVSPWTLVFEGEKLETGEEIRNREKRELARRLSAEREESNREEEHVRLGQKENNGKIVTIIVVAAIAVFVGLVILVSSYD